jgi:Lrp/AsnC family transcriptional regulator for asnA, asnC and gidA
LQVGTLEKNTVNEAEHLLTGVEDSIREVLVVRSTHTRGLLDELDLQILDMIKGNARLSIRELARALKRSPSVIHRRLKRLERLGIVKGYTALLDYTKLGYGIHALTLLQVEGEHITDVERMLAQEANVRAVYDITGEYDIAIITVFSSVSELDSFIKRILKVPYIKRSVTNIILRVVKDSPNIGLSLSGGFPLRTPPGGTN